MKSTSKHLVANVNPRYRGEGSGIRRNAGTIPLERKDSANPAFHTPHSTWGRTNGYDNSVPFYYPSRDTLSSKPRSFTEDASTSRNRAEKENRYQYDLGKDPAQEDLHHCRLPYRGKKKRKGQEGIVQQTKTVALSPSPWVSTKFTMKQWKALVFAYPLYGTLAWHLFALSMSETDEKKEWRAPAKKMAYDPPTEAQTNYFIENGIPKIAAAFDLSPAEVTEEEEVSRKGIDKQEKEEPVKCRYPAHPVSGNGSTALCSSSTFSSGFEFPVSHLHWRHRVPVAVDTLLCELFGILPLSSSSVVVLGVCDGVLSQSEHILLRLCDKERQRVDSYYNLFLHVEKELEVFRDEYRMFPPSHVSLHPSSSSSAGAHGEGPYLVAASSSTQEGSLDEAKEKENAEHPGNRKSDFTTSQRKPILTKGENGELYPWSYEPLPSPRSKTCDAALESSSVACRSPPINAMTTDGIRRPISKDTESGGHLLLSTSSDDLSGDGKERMERYLVDKVECTGVAHHDPFPPSHEGENVVPLTDPQLSPYRVASSPMSAHSRYRRLASVSPAPDERGGGTENTTVSTAPLGSHREVEHKKWNGLAPSSSSVAATAGLAFVCEVCLEGDGDLFHCGHCQGLRHEACGGPRPPVSASPSSSSHDRRMGLDHGGPNVTRRTSGETTDRHLEETRKREHGAPSLMLCKDCRRAMQLSGDDRSGSSSLRSSTSTDEREELGSLLEDEEDSSLSGFIVRTSDDDGDSDSTHSGRTSPPSVRHGHSKAKKEETAGRRPSVGPLLDENQSETDEADDGASSEEELLFPSLQKKRKRKVTSLGSTSSSSSSPHSRCRSHHSGDRDHDVEKENGRNRMQARSPHAAEKKEKKNKKHETRRKRLKRKLS